MTKNFHGRIKGTIALVEENNQILGAQGNQLNSINEKTLKTANEVSKAQKAASEIEHSVWVKKLMLRGIATLLTLINIFLFLKILFH